MTPRRRLAEIWLLPTKRISLTPVLSPSLMREDHVDAAIRQVDDARRHAARGRGRGGDRLRGCAERRHPPWPDCRDARLGLENRLDRAPSRPCLLPSITTRLMIGPWKRPPCGCPGLVCCAKAVSAAVTPAIIALMATMAVVAGFFRRFVVVDIINWPVSLYLPSGAPADWL